MSLEKNPDNSKCETTGIDPSVASEILQDMFFVAKIFQIQNYLDDKWLKDYYTKIAISYLSIVLHECLQAKLLDKEKADKVAVKILASIRQRIVKLVPDGNSDSMKHIIDTMGIDFDHYCFDLQITLNESNNQELFDIGFTYYDLLNTTEELDVFNSLIRIPFQIIEGVLSETSLNEFKAELAILGQSIYSNMGDYVSKSIVLHKYPYASGVFFKYPEICREDKLVVLYYYTLVKQAMMLDILIPDYTYKDEIVIDTTPAKCKFRAIIIENIGQYLKKSDSPMAKELCVGINNAVEKSFFSKNRSVKNNIHYKKTTVYGKDEIVKLYAQQELYLEAVKKIFDSKIKYKVGWKYRLIRFIADKTDATMIEVRKKNKNMKRFEDVSIDEWENARERIRKKDEML